MQVKLANNTVVHTNKFVRCFVDFGAKSGYLHFTVLPDCPLVLGLTFLRAYQPCIDWETMSITLDKGGTSSPHV